ncbi:somatic embryogenesis receptor kinase 2 [Phtheirospermum japonicum]|uniref:Somatic embryogenesis receptor kinase 2 n=1 Tax=Phtheirospermum japonicum TaxID=374723 RepID=A0A830B4B3_9LAMI|nr:somatic embryogenesis receptor kinase 2 [Phtheirospermum japonicum]
MVSCETSCCCILHTCDELVWISRCFPVPSLCEQLGPLEMYSTYKFQKFDTELNDNNLEGPIPLELGNLISLMELNIFNNSFSGAFPDTFGNLVNLRTLQLHINNLTGPIPLAMPYIRNLEMVSLGLNAGLCGPFTALCIDVSTYPFTCPPIDAINGTCPCRCGNTYTIPCEKNITDIKDCPWNP